MSGTFTVAELIYKHNSRRGVVETQGDGQTDYGDILSKIQHIISDKHSAELAQTLYSEAAETRLKTLITRYLNSERFCPRSHMQYVDVFETYIDELCRVNKNPKSAITVNSLYVVDDEKQREKMAGEFYGAIRKEIELYMEKINYLISSESQSPSIMNRWVLKVNELEAKKRNYEEILQRDFESLNDDFAELRLQAQELILRARKVSSCA